MSSLIKVYLFTWKPWATWTVSGNKVVYDVVLGCVVTAQSLESEDHVGGQSCVGDQAWIKTLEIKAGDLVASTSCMLPQVIATSKSSSLDSTGNRQLEDCLKLLDTVLCAASFTWF